MANQNYSAEEVKDITDREKLCLDFLKEQQMCPAVQMNIVNTGDDVFGIKPVPFLRDMKFDKSLPKEEPVLSPIQDLDESPEATA